MALRLLAYRALGLGDLLTGLPALRGLEAACPGHRLVLATTAAVAPLARSVREIDDVLEVAGELAAPPWTGPPPDIAVNLHGAGPESTSLLRALRPRRLVATTGWDPRPHEVERWCGLVDGAFGGSCDRSALDLPVPPGPPLAAGAVVVHPGAAFGSRRWPAARFAAVAAALAADRHRVVVTGSAAEVPLARSVARGAGLDQGAVLAGRTDVLGLAALVAAAALVISGDTGVAHLATAYGRPSVVLFGPTSPALWGPPAGREQHVALWSRDGMAGDPRADEADPALVAIGVEEVLAAARTVCGRGLGVPRAV